MSDTKLGVFKITPEESQRRQRIVDEAISNVQSDDKDGPSESVLRVYREYINGNIKNMVEVGKLVREAATQDAVRAVSLLHHNA